MDGTFRISSKKFLLFIVMVVNEFNKGIPVGYFLFSAPAGSKLYSSHYDSNILARFLCAFQQVVTVANQRDDGMQEMFTPKARIYFESSQNRYKH